MQCTDHTTVESSDDDSQFVLSSQYACSCVQGSITSGGFPIVSAELLPQPCMSWPSMYILATARRGPNGGLACAALGFAKVADV